MRGVREAVNRWALVPVSTDTSRSGMSLLWLLIACSLAHSVTPTLSHCQPCCSHSSRFSGFPSLVSPSKTSIHETLLSTRHGTFPRLLLSSDYRRVTTQKLIGSSKGECSQSDYRFIGRRRARNFPSLSSVLEMLSSRLDCPVSG